MILVLAVVVGDLLLAVGLRSAELCQQYVLEVLVAEWGPKV